MDTEIFPKDMISNNISSVDPNAFTSDEMRLILGIIFYIVYVGFFLFIYYVINGISFMKIARDLKMRKTYFSWIPILSYIQKLNIIGLSGWYILLWLLIFIPILGWLGIIGFNIFLWMKICEKKGKPDYLGLLTLIPMAKYILPLYLAFGDNNKNNNII